MLDSIKGILSDTNPIRLVFHKFKAVVAALIYRFPAKDMIVIGVTGTNGKTTTVNLITDILNKAGHKVGMTSTINFQIANKRWTNITKQTTLGPFVFQKMLREMADSGCKYAVLEVSSHAITQSRVFGVNFDVAVVTNVTPEHIEYHGSFDNYIKAKGGLFKLVSNGKRKPGIPKVLIANKDDSSFDFFNVFTADKIMNYGFKNASVYMSDLEKHPLGSSFTINTPDGKIPVKLKIPGDFNVYNSLAAASVALALNVSKKDIENGLNSVNGVAGRYETVETGKNFNAVVDYAHTTEALESLLSLYKNLSKGRLIAVFGCTGGGRDQAKRPKMGAIADELADFIILTNDDTYVEDEWTIIKHIACGVQRKEGENFWMIPDRRSALKLALNVAKEGDTIVAAGKGAEEIIMLKDGAHKWNDKQVIMELIKEM